MCLCLLEQLFDDLFIKCSPSITVPPPRLCGAVFIITTLSHHQSDWWPFLLREADAAYLWTHAGRACWQRRGEKKQKNSHIVKDVCISRIVLLFS